MSLAEREAPHPAPFPLPRLSDARRGIALAVGGLVLIAAVSFPLGAALDAEAGDLRFALIYTLSAIVFEV